MPRKQVYEGSFGARDGLKLYYRLFGGEKQSAPLLVVVHGFGEHCLRYLPLIDFLSELPVSIVLWDLRGHGQSEGERVYVNRFEEYGEDLEALLGFLREHHRVGQDRIILLGHSMGGEIAALYAATRPRQVELLLLSSPCLAIRLWMPGAEFIVSCLARLLPHWVIHNPVRPVFLTHDEKEVRQYKVDPLIQRKITFRLAAEMIRAGRDMRTQAAEILAPLYVLVAEEDRIVKKDDAREFYNRASSKEKKWIEFEGFYHEIFKEKGRERAFNVVRSVVAKQLAQSRSS